MKSSRWSPRLAGIAVVCVASCADDVEPLNNGPSDSGEACAACDPPRGGLFCGYAIGCEGTPQLGCHFDGSGDAVSVTYCGCDRQTFNPRRFGGSDGVAAADKPFYSTMPCPGLVPDAGDLDAGGACDACDPPRAGLFCGYRPGCGSDLPELACYRDGSGDALIREFCGCDGQTFSPMRFGGSGGFPAADRPFSNEGTCGLQDASVSD